MTQAKVLYGHWATHLPTLPTGSVDAIITDAPYNTTALAFDQQPVDWPAWWAEAHRVLKDTGVVVHFAADLFTVDLIQSNRRDYRYRLVWEKSRATGFLDANLRPLRGHEDIVIFARRFKDSTYNVQKQPAERFTRSTFKEGVLPSNTHWGPGKGRHAWEDDGTRHPTTVLKFPSVKSQATVHPTQKPLELMRWLVRAYTNPGDLVLDPFAGSGTTGVACVEEGRSFIGCELDLSYHNIAVRRVADAQPSLFGGLKYA